jgi:hypothetical protein
MKRMGRLRLLKQHPSTIMLSSCSPSSLYNRLFPHSKVVLHYIRLAHGRDVLFLYLLEKV